MHVVSVCACVCCGPGPTTPSLLLQLRSAATCTSDWALTMQSCVVRACTLQKAGRQFPAPSCSVVGKPWCSTPLSGRSYHWTSAAAVDTQPPPLVGSRHACLPSVPRLPPSHPCTQAASWCRLWTSGSTWPSFLQPLKPSREVRKLALSDAKEPSTSRARGLAGQRHDSWRMTLAVSRQFRRACLPRTRRPDAPLPQSSTCRPSNPCSMPLTTWG